MHSKCTQPAAALNHSWHPSKTALSLTEDQILMSYKVDPIATQFILTKRLSISLAVALTALSFTFFCADG